MNQHIKIFDIFQEYKDRAPQNWEEFDVFVDKCGAAGYDQLVEYLISWKADMHYYMEREFDTVPVHNSEGTER